MRNKNDLVEIFSFFKLLLEETIVFPIEKRMTELFWIPNTL